MIPGGRLGKGEEGESIGFDVARRSVVGGRGDEAGDNAADVGINSRNGETEGEAGDGTGSIGADTGEGTEGGNVARKIAVKAGDDVLRGGLKTDSTLIVAEARPEAQDVAERGEGECGEIREMAEEAMVVRDDAFYLGLLEHTFGYEDVIGGGILTPGEAAPVAVKPGEECGLEYGDCVIVYGHGGG